MLLELALHAFSVGKHSLPHVKPCVVGQDEDIFGQQDGQSSHRDT